MTTRIVTAIGALAGIAAVTASVASANPLLSGYGGPGQGSQVALGGTLLGGAGGGPGETASPTPLAATTPSSSPARGSGPTTHASSGGPAGPQLKRRVKAPTGLVPQPAATLPASYPGPAGVQAPLGISGQDLVYGLLVLALMGVMGAVTRELARGPEKHVR